jgi:hypothetical protein
MLLRISGAEATAPSGSSRHIMRWPCSAAADEGLADVARHIVDTHFEASSLDVNGIL